MPVSEHVICCFCLYTGDVTEGDLQELFRPFGPISRVFLAVDRATGENRGFAFVNYHVRCVLGGGGCDFWGEEMLHVDTVATHEWGGVTGTKSVSLVESG